MNLPPYDPYPTIGDDRIVLRQILTADLADILPISVYDSVYATTVDEAAAMQEKIDRNYRDGNAVHWGIADQTTDKLVGTCGYYRGFAEGAGELGCVLLPQFHGQGFMTRALQLAITFGLHDIGLQRIWALTTKGNHRAIKLLERLAFSVVAERENERVEYELIRTYFYAIYKSG